MKKFVAIAVVLFSVQSFAKPVTISCEEGPLPHNNLRVSMLESEQGEIAVVSVGSLQLAAPAKAFAVVKQKNPNITKLVGVAIANKEAGTSMLVSEGEEGEYGRETVDITVAQNPKDGSAAEVVRFYGCSFRQESIGYKFGR